MAVDRRTFLAALGGSALLRAPRATAPGWRARVATIDITPRHSTWMAGFAARTSASQGVALPLHAKALCLDDGAGRRVVLVTLDLLGLTTGVGARIAEAARRRYGLARANLLLNSSHTHCGPVIDEMLAVAYAMTDAQWRDVRAYTAELEDKVVRVIGSSLKRGEPVELRATEGRATFAANRRVQFTPLGPVDHRVPVLRVDGRRGPLAIVFGYACHNTTLRADFVRFHGDYAGVAQAELERRHPGATALFVAGCGGDANPDPRGTLDHVNRYGAALADAVDQAGPGDVIHGTLGTAYRTVDLPFAPPPDRAGWAVRLEDADPYVRRHARLMLDGSIADGRLPETQPDPIQVWRTGRGLTIVAMGGEVVVDYALRLARDYPRQRLWAAGYSNDVFGYVPSRRVLVEGGYEGGGAMIYYGKPGPFALPWKSGIHVMVKALMDEVAGQKCDRTGRVQGTSGGGSRVESRESSEVPGDGGAGAAAAVTRPVRAAGAGAAATGPNGVGEPALLGGAPVRTEAFPAWPIADAREEEALLGVLRSGKWGGASASRSSSSSAPMRAHRGPPLPGHRQWLHGPAHVALRAGRGRGRRGDRAALHVRGHRERGAPARRPPDLRGHRHRDVPDRRPEDRGRDHGEDARDRPRAPRRFRGRSGHHPASGPAARSARARRRLPGPSR
jgi:hypothetical protein